MDYGVGALWSDADDLDLSNNSNLLRNPGYDTSVNARIDYMPMQFDANPRRLTNGPGNRGLLRQQTSMATETLSSLPMAASAT